MARTHYTDPQRQQAIDLAITQGTAAASRATGIPKGTIASWCNRAGVANVASERRQASIDACAKAWAERRGRMVNEMGRVAEQALNAASTALADGSTNKARDAATTMAILVDKAQLLSGEVTTRNEYRDARNALLDEARSHARRLRSVA